MKKYKDQNKQELQKSIILLAELHNSKKIDFNEASK